MPIQRLARAIGDSWRLARGPEINKPKSATAPPATSASCGLQPRPRPGGPSRSSSIDPPKPINQNYAAPDSSAPTLPRDKGIPPEMPERQHAGAPDAVLARPLSVASDPVATGRPRPGHPRPLARNGRELRLTRGASCCFGATPLGGELPRSNGQTTAWPS